MTSHRLTILILGLISAVSCFAGEPAASQLAAERQRLDLMEDQLNDLLGMKGLLPLDDPYDLTAWHQSSAALVRRDVRSDGKAVYSVHAVRASLRDLFAEMAKAAGLKARMDAAVALETLNQPVTVDLIGTDFSDLCEIVTGLVDLEYVAEGDQLTISNSAVAGFAGEREYYQQKAAHLYRTALKRFPESDDAVRAWRRVADTDAEAGAFDAAAAEYLELANRFPTSSEAPAALMGAAHAHQKLGDARTARALLARLTSDYMANPMAAESYLSLGDLAAAQKDYAAAYRFYEAAFESKAAHDRTPLARVRMAQMLLKKGDAPGAIKLLEAAKGGDEESRFWHAHALLEAHRPEDAARAFTSFLNDSPKSNLAGEAAVSLADALFEQGRLVEALEIYLSRNDGEQAGYVSYRIGVIYHQMGLSSRAVQALRTAVQKESDHAEAAAMELAGVYSEDEQFAKAGETYRSVGETSKDAAIAARAMLGAADCCFAEGRYADAVALYRRALAGALADEFRNHALVMLGDSYRRTGQLSLALLAYQGKVQ